jgi:hypothetical protein
VISVGLFVPLWGFRSAVDSADLRGFSPDFFEGIIGECLVPLCG